MFTRIISDRSTFTMVFCHNHAMAHDHTNIILFSCFFILANAKFSTYSLLLLNITNNIDMVEIRLVEHLTYFILNS